MKTETTSVNGLQVVVDVEDLARAMNSGWPYIITDSGRIVMLDT